MKNLPEEEMFKNIESRLRNYSEKPDDALWNRIAKDVAVAKEHGWIEWTHRGALVASVILFSLIMFPSGDYSRMESRLSLHDKDQQAKSNNDEIAQKENQKPESLEKKDESSLENSEDKNEKISRENAQLNTADKKNSTSGIPASGNSISNNQLSKRSTPKDSGKNRLENRVEEDAQNESVTTNTGEEIVTSKPASSDQESNISTTQTDDAATPLSTEINVSEWVMDTTTSTLPVVVTQVKSDSVLSSKRIQQEKKSKKKSTTEYYFSVGPTLSFHQLTPAKNDQVVVSGLISPSIVSKERLGVQLKGGIQLPIAKRFSLYSGLSIYYQDQQFSYSYQTGDEVVLTQGPDQEYNVSPVLQRKEVNYKMLNVGGEAGFLYSLHEGPLTHKAGAGLGYEHGLLTSDKSYSNSRSGYLSYLIFYRNEYSVRPGLKFYLQPTFQNTFYSSEKLSEPFSLKSYRAGITIGLTLRLK